MGLTKPEVIQETNSIRDTEPAYKLNMPEKYTPAYYFDPASRTLYVVLVVSRGCVSFTTLE